MLVVNFFPRTFSSTILSRPSPTHHFEKGRRPWGRRLCWSSHRSSGSHTLLLKVFLGVKKNRFSFSALEFLFVFCLPVNSFFSFFIKNHASIRSLSYNFFPSYFLVLNWFHLLFRGKGLGARLIEEVNNLFIISKALRKLNCQVTKMWWYTHAYQTCQSWGISF